MLNAAGGPSDTATLLLGNSEFKMPVVPGIIDTLYIMDGIAARPSDPLASVLCITREPDGIHLDVQAVNPCELTVYDARTGKVLHAKVVDKGLDRVKAK
jgi:hypothetical protein